MSMLKALRAQPSIFEELGVSPDEIIVKDHQDDDSGISLTEARRQAPEFMVCDKRFYDEMEKLVRPNARTLRLAGEAASKWWKR